jgi:hypothetical protein
MKGKNDRRRIGLMKNKGRKRRIKGKQFISGSFNDAVSSATELNSGMINE